MSFCVERGISHSEFLSWSPEDRAKTLAFLMEQSENCALCGTAPWEWEENPYAYEPEEVWCKGCYVKHAASEEGGKLPGTTVTLALNTPLRQAQQEMLQKKRRGKMRRSHEE
jgi:hypothetical protein